MNAELATLPTASRERWIELLKHAASTGSRPSAKWLKAANKNIEALGGEEFSNKVLHWKGSPAAIAATPLVAAAGTVHWPTSWLMPPQPQAMTLPSCFRARLWAGPAAIAVTPLAAAAGTVHCP